MYIHYTYSTYVLYRSVRTIVLQAYTTHDGVNCLTCWKYTVLNGNSVLHMHNIFRNTTQA